MSEPAFSVTQAKDGRIVFRLYVNIHRAKAEYYEVTMPAADARRLGLDLMNEAEKASWLQSSK